MDKILILSAGNIPKSHKMFLLFMGFFFLLQGVVNLHNNSSYSLLSILYITMALVYILAILFYYKEQDRTPFIKLTESEIAFKKSPLSKEVILNINDILDLDITNYKLRIEIKDKSYIISFSNLSYIQRKNELPAFVNELQELKRKIISNKKAP
jgi:hypothetical protein